MSVINAEVRQNTSLMLMLAVICFALLVLLLSLSGAGTSNAYTSEELLAIENAKVQVQPLKRQQSYERKRLVYGTIESSKRADLAFELAGSLAEVLVVEGQRVTQGQIIAKLDIARLEAEVKQLQAAYERALADENLARISNQRVRELVEAKLEPQQVLDESQARLQAASASVEESDARLNRLQVELEKSTLRAPFDGQIVMQYLDVGTVLNNSEPVFSLIADELLEARFGLPENTAFGVQVGDEFMLNMGDIRIPASVRSVAKERKLATRTLDAILTIDASALSPDALFTMVSGNLVSIDVKTRVNKPGSWVSLDGLSSGIRGLWSVFIYQPSSQTIESRIVRLEHLDGERAFVSGSIADGELMVTNGTQRLVAGQILKNVEVTEPPLDVVTRQEQGQ